MPKTLSLGEMFYSEDGQFEFTVTSISHREVSIKAADIWNLSGELIIPEYVIGPDGNLYSVTAIDDYGFCCYKYSNLTGNLIIPNSVKIIGNYAFYGCYGFEGDLIIPNGVVEIGDYAFAYCYGLYGDLIIPESVKIIGIGAFMGSNFGRIEMYLTDLSQVEYLGFEWDKVYCPKGYKLMYEQHGFFTVCEMGVFLNIGEEFYSEDDQFIFKVTGEGQVSIRAADIWSLYGELIIPEYVIGPDGNLYSVTAIEDYGFCCYKSSNFTGSLIIPNSVKTIGDYAFYGCYGFEGTLIIPASVISIGEYAFSRCYFDDILIMPNGVVEIGYNAFDYIFV